MACLFGCIFIFSSRGLRSDNISIFPGHVNVAPRHLTAEAETLLSATLIHEVGLVYA